MVESRRLAKIGSGKEDEQRRTDFIENNDEIHAWETTALGRLSFFLLSRQRAKVYRP